MNDIKQLLIEEEDDFDIKKFISRILEHWKLYVVSVVVFLAGAWLYLRYATPMYKAHAEVLVQDNQNNNGSSFLQSSALSDFSGMFDFKSNVNDELAILQTSDLLERVVEELNLNVTYYHEGRIRSVELYDHSPFYVDFIPVSDSIQPQAFTLQFSEKDGGNDFTLTNDDLKFTAKAKFGDTILTDVGKLCITKTGLPFDDADYRFTLASTDAVVTSMIGNLTVEIPSKEANVINLSYNSNVPKKAEDILGKLIAEYIKRNLNEKNKISDSTIAFIDGRIGLVANDLNNIEANIQGFKQQNKLANIDEQSKTLISNTSDYYNKLNDIDVQLNIVSTVLNSVQNDPERPVPSLVDTDPGFIALIGKYNALLSQRDKLLLSTTEGNPLVRNVDGQLASVRNDMIKSLQNQQQALQVSRQNIVSENATLNNMVANVPVQERKYVDLSRERDVKQALYLFLLQKKEETAITKSSNIPSASVIKVPKCEYLPYYPKTSMAYGVGLLLGLVVPFSFLWLKGILNTRITTTEDITEHTDVTVIAEIGHSDKEGLLSIEEDGRSILAEQFRVFRTNMDFLTPNEKCSKILITSSMSGEGKSFIATNLAQIYAVSGKRVLLMEMDLRRPKISEMLGMPNELGFSNYIISDKRVELFIFPVDKADNVFLMSSGPIPPNPAELLVNKKMHTMFEELSELFDVIIVDSPPIGAVADAQILAKHCDANLFIVRQKYTYRNSLKLLNEFLSKRLSNLYVVFNDIQRDALNYSYRYGYGSGYRCYGYMQQDTKETTGFKLTSKIKVFK